MKKINIIIGLIILFVFNSCKEDILDTHPYDLKVTGNFYKTPDDAYQALVAAYSVLDWGYYDHFIVISEVMSDNCYGGCGASDDQRYQVWDDCDELLYPNSHDLLWQRYWYGIFRANLLLQNIGIVNWGSNPELEVQYTAECRFLRAHYYFDVVRLFGNIPLLDKPADPNNLNFPQAKPEEVYKLIAEDLKYAAEKLPAKPYSREDASVNGGRVTRWAAKALLTRVFLFYTGYFNKSNLAGVITKQEAENLIDDVIDNSGYSLVDNFTHLWQYSDESQMGGSNNFVGEDNKETVFGIKHTYKGFTDSKQQNGAQWQIMIGIRAQTSPKAHAPFGEGWGAGTVDPRLWNAYEPGDTRKSGTIICWDSLNLATPINFSDMREYTGLEWKKYCPLEDSTGKRLVEKMGGQYIYDNYQDYVDIRFADVLLMSAELHLDDNLAKSQEYYDMIRDRAFLNQNHRKQLTASNGKDLIFEERKLELALEAHRYWDLLRYDGIAGNFAYAENAINTDLPYYQHFRPETQGLMLIPATQINLSKGTLVQNPGW